MANLLVIEKHGALRMALERCLGPSVSIDSVTTVESAEAKMSETCFNVVIYLASSSWSKRLKAVRAVEKLSQTHRTGKFIIASNGDEPEIRLPHGKAYQWVQLPIDDSYLGGVIVATLQKKSDSAAGELSSPDLPIPTQFEGVLAISLPMRAVIQQVIEAAAVDAPVLVSGETGTGKDLIATAIHKRSQRSKHTYLPVNMGAIPHDLIASELFGHEKGAFTGASESQMGVFEQAHGGTLFLDEITTMDEKTQVSLLRVLETQTIRRVGGIKDVSVDTRVIAATNENIEEAVKARRFREDLYYRLDVIRIHLPPLRERPGDVSFLTNHFISRYSNLYKKAIRVASPEIYQLLRAYEWPGNVRELKNVIQRAVVMASGIELTLDLLPERIRSTIPTSANQPAPLSLVHLGMTLADAEKALITMTVGSVGGNKAKAAAILGVSRHALYDKLKRHGLL